MLAEDVLENPGQESIALNRRRSDELLLEIFEILSEGIIKFARPNATKEAQKVSAGFVFFRLSADEVLVMEKEIV